MLEAPYAPVPIDDVLLAFPGDIAHLLPDWDDIPDEFKKASEQTESSRKWLKLQQDWFARGVSNPLIDLEDGIDGETAWRHLSAIQGSYAPKHEHKESAVAFLASLWFRSIEYETPAATKV